MQFFTEFWRFLLLRRKFWLFPVILVALLLGGIVVVSQGSAVAPFIYAIF